MVAINIRLLLKTKLALVLTVYVLPKQKTVGKFDVHARSSIYVSSLAKSITGGPGMDDNAKHGRPG